MLLRRETTADMAAIGNYHRRAFGALGIHDGPPVEDRLVRALRDDVGWVPALSIVAEDGAGEVVGHVLATEGRLAGTPAIGIAPLAVLPDHQRGGIGAALMYAVIAAADALDYPVEVLLGDPTYYSRFGFAPAATLSVNAPDPGWGEHFQARRLAAFAGQSGDFEYAAPFNALRAS